MFSREPMSVFDWWVYFILLMIPIVNIVLFIMILLSSHANRSVKSLEMALVLPVLIFGIYFMIAGFPSIALHGPF